MPKIRVLIVDDSAYSRQTIKKMLESDSHIEVIGVASDGLDAMSKTLRLKPDLITLDLEMPEMDGFTFLRWLMKNKPTPVIIVSSFSDSKTVFKALEMGAADFIAKPPKISSPDYQNMVKDLLVKVKAMKALRLDRLSKNLEILEQEGYSESTCVPEEYNIETVAIGSSTGGPSALSIILTKLPSDFPASIVISQHMPKGFTNSFAERLNSICKIKVKEASEGDELEPGKAFICPGGYHMTFYKRGKKVFIMIKESKQTDKYVPSIDMMMSSLVNIYKSKILGIVLTGMGNDGTAGMLDIKKAGGYTIVESEDTAIVNGMPAEVTKAGAAIRVLPVNEIPGEIISMIKKINTQNKDN
ncbi:MAG: chemotaxis response regulator protein-glutamate methylesterase [Nitrospirae bacterium]|jgi:two-component system chemotaxis response regulator CheB|nr:chemotaxis response regulator protein-glutamate methylesterase [Nitrospirota bacterium]